MSDSGHGGPGFSFQNGVWLSKSGGTRAEKFQKWSDDKTKSQVRRLDLEEHSSMVKISGDCLDIRKELRSLQNTRRQLSLHGRHPSYCTPSSPHATSPSTPVDHDPFSPPSAASPTASAGPGSTSGRPSGMKKSSSFNSLTSMSSGYGSSLGSPKAASTSLALPESVAETAAARATASGGTVLVGRRSGGLSSEDHAKGRSASGSRGDAFGAAHGGVFPARSLKGASSGCNLNADAAALRLKNLHSARALSKLNNNMEV